MPTSTTIDGISRELIAWPATIDGVTREHAQLYAAIDGVQREIFPTAKHRWEKYAVWHYFGETSVTGISFSASSAQFERYLGNYRESGTESVKGSALQDGDYFINAGKDYLFVGGWMTSMKEVLSYTPGPSDTVQEIVESADETAYPENGEQDGFWYIKVE